MTYTNTTLQILKTIRSAFLDFQPSVSGSVSGTLADRIYINQPPDNVVFPFVVARLVNNLTTSEFRGDRLTVDAEVTIFDRPRSNTLRAEGVADQMDGAMTRLRRQDSSGLLMCRSRTRDTIVPSGDPADREVVSIRLVYPLVVWPQYLTQFSGSL